MKTITQASLFISNGSNLPHLHFGINTSAPSYFGYTPTTACIDQLGFVDPEQFIETRQPAKKTCNTIDDTVTTSQNTLVTTKDLLANNKDCTDTAVVSITVSASLPEEGNNGGGGFDFYTIIGLLLLSLRIFRRQRK